MQPPQINLPGEGSYAELPKHYEPLPADMSLAEIANTTDPTIYVRAIGATTLVADEIYRTLVRRNPGEPMSPSQLAYRVGRLYTGLGEACVLRGIYGANPGDVADSFAYFSQANYKLTLLGAIDEAFQPPPGEPTIDQALNLNVSRAAEALGLLGDGLALWLPDPPETIDVSNIVIIWHKAITSALRFCNDIRAGGDQQDKMRKCA